MKTLKGFKVLVVEDDPDLCEIVSEELTIAGADVDTASSGKEAILLVKAKSYDFILSDMRMPNGDGRFLAAKLVKLPEPKPLFFIYSGFNDITAVEKINLEIVEFFAKPFLTSDIIKSILSKFKKSIAA